MVFQCNGYRVKLVEVGDSGKVPPTESRPASRQGRIRDRDQLRFSKEQSRLEESSHRELMLSWEVQ